MAYEKKLVPSSGKGSSISVSPAFCQGEERAGCIREPGLHPHRVLPRDDKVVALLDKFQNTGHLSG